MAGGTIYLEPILEELTEKINNIVEKVDDIVDVIDTKVQAQIQELQNVATIVGASASPSNVKITNIGEVNKVDNIIAFSKFSHTGYAQNYSGTKKISSILANLTGKIAIKISGIKVHFNNPNAYGVQTISVSMGLNGTYLSKTGYSKTSDKTAEIIDDTAELTGILEVEAGQTYDIVLDISTNNTAATDAGKFTTSVESLEDTNLQISFTYLNPMNPEQGFEVIPVNEGV